MNEEFDSLSLFAMAELEQLRAQALNLFDQCLAENNLAPIISFIEHKIQEDPPHLPLLREVSDGLQQRLLSLREHDFDVRQRVLQIFRDDYGIDIAPLVPAEGYHLMNVKRVLASARQHGKQISEEDLLILGKLLEVSVKTAALLDSQIRMVSELQALIVDWLKALRATVGRRYWSDDQPAAPIQ